MFANQDVSSSENLCSSSIMPASLWLWYLIVFLVLSNKLSTTLLSSVVCHKNVEYDLPQT